MVSASLKYAAEHPEMISTSTRMPVSHSSEEEMKNFEKICYLYTDALVDNILFGKKTSPKKKRIIHDNYEIFTLKNAYKRML